MKKWEKTSIILWAVAIPLLIIFGLILDSSNASDVIIKTWAVILGIVWAPWGWFNLGLTIRDMFKRDLDSRCAWILLVLITFGIGWIIYLIKYGWKERNRAQSHAGDGLRPCLDA